MGSPWRPIEAQSHVHRVQGRGQIAQRARQRHSGIVPPEGHLVRVVVQDRPDGEVCAARRIREEASSVRHAASDP